MIEKHWEKGSHSAEMQEGLRVVLVQVTGMPSWLDMNVSPQGKGGKMGTRAYLKR